MIEEAIEKARAYSDNKDKIDAYYDGYVACHLKLNKQLKAEHTRGEIDFVNMHCNSSCKKVMELEDKIKHLTQHLEPQSMSALFEQVEEEVKQKQRIEELEKENAELKEKYDTCLRENTGLKIHNAYVEKKLTEAKEIIRELLECYKYVTRFSEYANKKPIAKAEAFLKE